MNKMLKVFKVLVIVVFISSCATKIPLTSNYYSNNKTVGVLFLIEDIGVYKAGAQGLLEMALTSGDRFKEALYSVDLKVNPKDDIKNAYRQLLNSKGKSFKELDFNYDTSKLTKFKSQSSSKKKFYKYDLRFLKEQGIDELLIVRAKYGILVSYYGFIETGKDGNCRIDSSIINLSDNSIIYSDFSNSTIKIQGKWKTPPKYEALTSSISSAIKNAIYTEKNKLNK